MESMGKKTQRRRRWFTSEFKAEIGPEFIFLMRHGKHIRGRLDEGAVGSVRAVGERFAEWLADGASPGAKIVFQYGSLNSPEAKQTARELIEWTSSELSDVQPRAVVSVAWQKDTERSAHKIPAYIAAGAEPLHREEVAAAAKWLKHSDPATWARLIVGNEPAIGWIAAELTGGPIAFAHGELVCLSRTRRRGWRLHWNLVDEDKELLKSLQDKIKSKMDTAKALGATIVALATFVLTQGLGPSREPTSWLWASLAALGTSAALYFATLFLYDSLQMPPRFWGSRYPKAGKRSRTGDAIGRLRSGKKGVARPPSSTGRVVHDAMIHVWTWVFLPATLFAGLGVVLLAVSVADPSPASPSAGLVLGTAIVIALAVGVWVAWHRPQIGAAD